MSDDALIAARLRTLRTQWLVLTASNLAFAGIVTSGMLTERGGTPPHLAELFAAMSLGIAIVSVAFPARHLDLALRRMRVHVSEHAGEIVGSFRASVPIRRVIDEPERVVADALGTYQTPFLLGMALTEAIALFGVMLGFQGTPVWACLPFFALALAIMIAKYPSVEIVTRALERVTNASCPLTPSSTSTNR